MDHGRGGCADDTVGPAAPADSELAATLAVLRAAGARQLTEGRVVASGGMGVISAVEDPLLHRLLARKSLSAQAAGDTSLQAALLREARVMGALEHPGVVPVHELGIDAEGQPFFTMALVGGEDLSHVYRRLRGGDPEQVASRGALKDPAALDAIVDIAGSR